LIISLSNNLATPLGMMVFVDSWPASHIGASGKEQWLRLNHRDKGPETGLRMMSGT
jgi:hypothetical protein